MEVGGVAGQNDYGARIIDLYRRRRPFRTNRLLEEPGLIRREKLVVYSPISDRARKSAGSGSVRAFAWFRVVIWAWMKASTSRRRTEAGSVIVELLSWRVDAFYSLGGGETDWPVEKRFGQDHVPIHKGTTLRQIPAPPALFFRRTTY